MQQPDMVTCTVVAVIRKPTWPSSFPPSSSYVFGLDPGREPVDLNASASFSTAEFATKAPKSIKPKPPSQPVEAKTFGRATTPTPIAERMMLKTARVSEHELWVMRVRVHHKL